MNKAYLLTALLCIVFAAAGIARGEVVTRSQGESAADFVRRYAPNGSEMTEKVLETEAFGANRAVIAFYTLQFESKNENYTEVHGYLYMPRSGGEYDKVLINNFGRGRRDAKDRVRLFRKRGQGQGPGTGRDLLLGAASLRRQRNPVRHVHF